MSSFDLPALLSDDLSARGLVDAVRDIRDRLGADRNGGMEVLAGLLNGAYFEGQVSSTEDTAFDHALGRIPSAILISVSLDSAAGHDVRGTPAGLGGAGNSTAWTDTRIYVQAATTSGQYGFVVI